MSSNMHQIKRIRTSTNIHNNNETLLTKPEHTVLNFGKHNNTM
jgi:hypothetical protein